MGYPQTSELKKNNLIQENLLSATRGGKRKKMLFRLSWSNHHLSIFVSASFRICYLLSALVNSGNIYSVSLFGHLHGLKDRELVSSWNRKAHGILFFSRTLKERLMASRARRNRTSEDVSRLSYDHLFHMI